MKHKKTIILFVVGAMAVAMTIGAVAYQSVLAATPTTTSTTSDSSSTPIDQGREFGRGPHGSYSEEDLATALGITTDELNTAYQNAQTAALEDAVAQGLITQEQADQMTESSSSSSHGKSRGGWLSQNGIDFDTYLADELGISVDELTAAYQTAYYANIDQAVTDGTLTQEQADLMKGQYALKNDATFQASMESAYTEAVNQAVASGVITQEQADLILSNSSNMFMPGMGGFGGHGGPRGHGGEMMNGTLPTDQP